MAPELTSGNSLAWANSRTIAELRTLIETRWDDLDTSAADQLLGKLLEHYAGQAAIVEELRSRRNLLYRCRTDGIHAAFASEGLQFDSRIVEAVSRFLTTGSEEIQSIFLENREILVSDEAQRLLEHLERYYQDDARLQGNVRERRDRMRVAIDKGVDKAFPIFANRKALEGAFKRLVEADDWVSKLEVIRTEAAVLLSDGADCLVESLLSAKLDHASRCIKCSHFIAASWPGRAGMEWTPSALTVAWCNRVRTTL